MVFVEQGSLRPSMCRALPPSFGINPQGEIVGIFDSRAIHGFLLSNGTFTTIDVPGAVSTAAESINLARRHRGAYRDSSGNLHGFLLSNGNFTTIDLPGAVQTQAFNINPRGDIVGTIMTAAATLMVICWSKGKFTTYGITGSRPDRRRMDGTRGDIVGNDDDSSANTTGYLLSR